MCDTRTLYIGSTVAVRRLKVLIRSGSKYYRNKSRHDGDKYNYQFKMVRLMLPVLMEQMA